MTIDLRSVALAVTVYSLFFATSPSFAQESEEFAAKVLSIHDGDTLRVRRLDNHRSYKVRLFAIDAPEISQEAGVASRDALCSLIDSNNVVVRPTGAVSYGRLVARVYVGDDYLNEAQVTDGWAWHYDHYTQGQPEHSAFAELQESAEGDGSGLWAYPEPIPPWEFRRLVRDGEILPFEEVSPPHSAALRLNRAHLAPEPSPRFLPRRSGRRSSGLRAAAASELFGNPVPFDNRHRFTPAGQNSEVAGITELHREAFTIGHYDKYRVPAWVAVKWTKDDFEESERVSFSRPPWRQDSELPAYARGDGKLDYAHTSLQKGHMARDADVEAWGLDAVEEATLLSNAVPQKEHANHAVWGVLEDQHRHIVENDEDDLDIETIWIVSGPIFYQGQDVEWVGITAIPHATYKVIAWIDSEAALQTRGFIIGQDDTRTELTSYLRPIDQIESATGLDFFAELPDDEEAEIESRSATSIWK